MLFSSEWNSYGQIATYFKKNNKIVQQQNSDYQKYIKF